ncbi:MAG: hypothetical protein U1E91_01810 [Moraxella sp.]
MGEYIDAAACEAAVVISAPVDLTTSAKSHASFCRQTRVYALFAQSFIAKSLQKGG